MPVIIARDQVREPLHVVVPYFNPWRWKSRPKHTERALKHFADSGAVITLVEIGYNRRELVFADFGLDGTVANCGIHGEFRHKYIGLHTKDELWLKENAINIGVQSLPYTWMQVAWLDSDVHFVRPNWAGEIIHKLQHYAFLQPFTQARDLAPNYEMLPEDYPHANGVSFLKSWSRTAIWKKISPEGGSFKTTGVARPDHRGPYQGARGRRPVNEGPSRSWPTISKGTTTGRGGYFLVLLGPVQEKPGTQSAAYQTFRSGAGRTGRWLMP